MKMLVTVLMGILRNASISCWSTLPVPGPLFQEQPHHRIPERVMRADGGFRKIVSLLKRAQE
jgi:hypothetical protein